MENIKKKKAIFSIITNIIHFVLVLLFLVLTILGFQKGIFTNDAYMQSFLNSIGLFAPIFFILIQIIQVIFPIIPGGATCLVGVLLFGPTLGFLYNYIGLTIGSIIVFFLSKKYSLKIIHILFKEKTIQKYMNILEKKNFKKLFLWMVILPGAPDDLLCYLVALTSIQTREFLKIIFLGKPISLFGYSLGIVFVPAFFNPPL